MALLDYTTYTEVRAALGVNDVELTDETLSLEMYSSNLNIELDDIDAAVSDRFVEVNAIQVDERTKAQQRFYDATRLFSTYAVAKQCCGSLPMFGPKSVTDAKAGVSRFTNDPYKETAKSVSKMWDVYYLKVQSALAGLSANTSLRTPLTLFAVSTPSVDEVTG